MGIKNFINGLGNNRVVIVDNGKPYSYWLDDCKYSTTKFKQGEFYLTDYGAIAKNQFSNYLKRGFLKKVDAPRPCINKWDWYIASDEAKKYFKYETCPGKVFTTKKDGVKLMKGGGYRYPWPSEEAMLHVGDKRVHVVFFQPESRWYCIDSMYYYPIWNYDYELIPQEDYHYDRVFVPPFFFWEEHHNEYGWLDDSDPDKYDLSKSSEMHFAQLFNPAHKNYKTMIKFFEQDGSTAVQTDAKDEREFLDDISNLMSEMMDDGAKREMLKGNMRALLPQIFDICCAYNNYKNNVQKKTLYTAGAMVAIEPFAETVSAEKLITNGKH